MEADDVLMAIGQENCFPWIERDLGIEFDKWDMPVVDPVTFQATNAKVFFGGDAAFGPENVITAVAHGHQAAVSIDLFCHDKAITDRPSPFTNLVSQKMGVHEWSYDNAIESDKRYVVPMADKAESLKDRKMEVELGFDISTGFKEEELRTRLEAPAGNLSQDLYVSQKLPTKRVMVKDEDVCLHCGLCAERCPTTAWDMQSFLYNVAMAGQ